METAIIIRRTHGTKLFSFQRFSGGFWMVINVPGRRGFVVQVSSLEYLNGS